MEIKQHLRDALELVAVPLFLINRNNQVVYLNKQAKEEIGENEAENIILQLSDDVSFIDSSQQFDQIFNKQGVDDNIQCVLKTENKKLLASGSARYLTSNELVLFTTKSCINVTDNYPLSFSKYPPSTKIEICRSILEKIPSEIYFINNDGVILFSNPYANSILASNIASGKISHIQDINPLATNEWWKSFTSQLETKGHITFETQHQYSKDNIYPMMVNLFYVQYNNQTLFCYQSTNITDQNNIQKSLLKELKINQSLAELSAELAKKQKLESVQLLVRQYALEITNSTFALITYHDPEIQKLRFSIYNDTGTDYKKEVEKIEKYITEQYYTKEEFPTELIINRSNDYIIEGISIKELLPFENILITGVFSSHELMGILMVAGQIEEYTIADAENLKSLSNLFAVAINRTKESNKLSESIEQLELAMEVANMSIFDVNASQDNLTINGTWQKSFGLTLKKDKSQPIEDMAQLIHPQDYKLLNKTIKKHQYSNSPSFEVNIRVKTKDDSYRWFMTTGRIVSLTKNGEIERLMGVSMDITNMVHLNEEILLSREVAVEASKAKSAFLARISHEFRTPLNAIIGLTDLLIDKSTNAVKLDYLHNIQKSGKNLLHLITDILDYSKIEAGKMTLQLVPVNIIDLSLETCQLFTQILEEKSLTLTTNFQEGIPLSLLLDQVQIRQILSNLVANAVKFTHEGGVTLTIKSSIVTKEEATLIFIVKDTGIGIRETEQKRIFEDFSQQGEQDNRRYGGTGLGLGIVSSLVQLMHGQIHLESTPGVGSTFTITLPNVIIYNQNLFHHPSNEKVRNNQDKMLAETKNMKVSFPLFSESQTKQWNDFKIRPSFKKAPVIIELLRCSKNDQYKSIVEYTTNKFEKSIQSFDVEALSKTIQEFENHFKK